MRTHARSFPVALTVLTAVATRLAAARTALAAFVLAAALLPGCGGGEHAPARQVPQYSIQDFLATVTYTGLSFSPDQSKILVSSDQSGVFNAYAVPTAGGDPVPLTESTTNSIFARAYFPGDERFLYTSDQGGNELDHLFVQTPEGNAVDITPGSGLKARFLGWARDDSTFYVATNERNHRYFDVYEYSPTTYARTLLYRNDTGTDFAAISPDRRTLALNKINSNTDSDIFLLDRRTGDTTLVTAHTGDMRNRPQDFSPDGKSLFYLTDDGHEFLYLVRYDLATGTRETVVKPDWDILSAGFSKDGKRLVVAINWDAHTEIQIYDYPGMRRVALPELPDAELTRPTFSRDGKLLAFYANSSRNPGDLFVMEAAGGTPRSLTHSLSPNIAPDDLVAGKVVRFESFDGVEIPGILYQPHPATKKNKVPALVWVHGGPGGQSRLRYSALIQYLVNHGYEVFAINNRGSSGYGKTFNTLDDRKHGEDDLGDCVASKKMLMETGVVLPEKIGIVGGSYGGYMVLAALAFRPDEFAVGVDLFGVANWLRTLESIPPWWASFRKALIKEIGDPEVDAAYLKRISPLFHAARIRRPLLVLQGANDPRVLKAESDEIVAAARGNGVPVEYIVFPDEGHGFLKKENRERGYEAILRFLDTYLKGSETPAGKAGAAPGGAPGQ